MNALDSADLRLLRALQEDGRLTNQQLAEMVNLSASQCSRRRSRLERDGVIAGYRALVNRDRVNLGIAAFVSVGLSSQSGDSVVQFAGYVSRIPEIIEAHALTGDMDYQLKVVVADLAGLSRLINEVLLPHQAVNAVRTSIILQILKENGPLPL